MIQSQSVKHSQQRNYQQEQYEMNKLQQSNNSGLSSSINANQLRESQQQTNFNTTQKFSPSNQLLINDLKIASGTPQNGVGNRLLNSNLIHQQKQTQQQTATNQVSEGNSSRHQVRGSSATAANRFIQLNVATNNCQEQQTPQNIQIRQQPVVSQQQSRPGSGGKKLIDMKMQQQQLQLQESEQRRIQENNNRNQIYQNQQTSDDQNDESKFRSLVCQVPQGIDPKTALQQQQRQQAQYQTQGKDESRTTTLESSVRKSNQQLEEEDQQVQYLLGPQRRTDIGKKTLVLDLDETLVHSSFKPVENPDIILPVEIEGSICNIYILVRPGVSTFLKRMYKHYELVVFTASLSKYADPLVDILDPEGMCSYKLFREHCTYVNNAFVKDLTRLGRPMKDIIILDNSPIAYMFQPENAIPCISWYDNMDDRELPRSANILERLAYEEDVRKVIRTIVSANNEIDQKQEQVYLRSQKRDHSQKVHERNHKKTNGRYESADNRSKHAAIINEQIKQRHGEIEQETQEKVGIQQQQYALQERQSRTLNNNFICPNDSDDSQKQQDEINENAMVQIQNYNPSRKERASLQSQKLNQSNQSKEYQIMQQQNYVQNSYPEPQAPDMRHPATTKGMINKNVFFNGTQKLNSSEHFASASSQNATPLAKRATSVRASSQTNPVRDQQRKERGHSASSQTRKEHSSSRKKNTFSNFMSNTQKLSRDEMLAQERSQISTAGTGYQRSSQNVPIDQRNANDVSPRPLTAGNQRQSSGSGSQQHSVRGHSQNLSASQRLQSQNFTAFTMMGNQQPIPASSQVSNHSKKPSTSNNPTNILKQSLKDFQDMLKLTQNKINKHSGSSNKHTYQLNSMNSDDASFLKKLSRHQELQGTPQNIMSVSQQPSSNVAQTAPTTQYASRYQVNSPKYKENQNILNSHNQQHQQQQQQQQQQNITSSNYVVSVAQGPQLQLQQNQNIIMQPNHIVAQTTKHQKRPSNPFQILNIQNNQEPETTQLARDEKLIMMQQQQQNQQSKNQQIKIIHNQNNNLRSSQTYKSSRMDTQGKFINSYLSSLSATPTAAATNGQIRQSVTKGISKDDPIFQNFSKNLYNQLGLGSK